MIIDINQRNPDIMRSHVLCEVMSLYSIQFAHCDLSYRLRFYLVVHKQNISFL